MSQYRLNNVKIARELQRLENDNHQLRMDLLENKKHIQEIESEVKKMSYMDKEERFLQIHRLFPDKTIVEKAQMAQICRQTATRYLKRAIN